MKGLMIHSKDSSTLRDIEKIRVSQIGPEYNLRSVRGVAVFRFGRGTYNLRPGRDVVCIHFVHVHR